MEKSHNSDSDRGPLVISTRNIQASDAVPEDGSLGVPSTQTS